MIVFYEANENILKISKTKKLYLDCDRKKQNSCLFHFSALHSSGGNFCWFIFQLVFSAKKIRFRTFLGFHCGGTIYSCTG